MPVPWEPAPETLLPVGYPTVLPISFPLFREIMTLGPKIVPECKDFPLCGNSGAFFIDNRVHPSYDFGTSFSPKRQLVTFYPLPVCQTTRASNYGC